MSVATRRMIGFTRMNSGVGVGWSSRGRAFEEVDLHVVSEPARGADDAVVAEHAGIPFPLFDDLGVSHVDQPA